MNRQEYNTRRAIYFLVNGCIIGISLLSSLFSGIMAILVGIVIFEVLYFAYFHDYMKGICLCRSYESVYGYDTQNFTNYRNFSCCS